MQYHVSRVNYKLQLTDPPCQFSLEKFPKRGGNSSPDILLDFKLTPNPIKVHFVNNFVRVSAFQCPTRIICFTCFVRFFFFNCFSLLC